jgi:4-coumarate--CoA ligase
MYENPSRPPSLDLMLVPADGMTESATIIAIFDASVPSAIDGASAGVLAPNVEAKIIAPDGRALGPGEVGELISRSPSNAIGCESLSARSRTALMKDGTDLGNEKATKETWDADGFLHTGDECYISRGGMLYVVDRLKE